MNEFTYNDVTYKRTLTMQLAGKGVDPLEGENGYAPTTWVMKGDSVPIGPELAVLEKQSGYVLNSWETSEMRSFLQGQFTSQIFPQDLLNYLRKVIKYTSVLKDKVVYTDYPTVDWFFSLSAHEMFGNATDYYGTIYVSTKVGETIGPAYDIFGTDDTISNLRSYLLWSNQITGNTWNVTRSNAYKANSGFVQAWGINVNGNAQSGGVSGHSRIGFCL